MMNYFQKKKLAFMSIVNRVKGFVRTITGVFPLTLTNCVDEESIIDYTLYGQSVQNGTPTPETPVEVESVGERTRNLFDISSYGDLIDGQKYPYIDISSFEIGTTYTISANDKFVFKINKSAGEGGSANGGIQVTNNESFTFTMTETYKSLGHLYIISRTAWRPSTKAELETQNIQLTESNTVLPYEPYGYKIPIKVSGNDKSMITNIYLDEPLRKVGDYADYVDLENGKVVRKIKKKQLTKAITLYTIGGVLGFHTDSGFLDSKYSRSKGLCNREKSFTETWVNDSGTTLWLGVNNTVVYWIGILTKLGFTTLAEMNAWLKENETWIYWATKTPTEEHIELPTIPTFKGTNIISADTTIQPSNAEITYYSNVKE